jgi:hypothetical protein
VLKDRLAIEIASARINQPETDITDDLVSFVTLNRKPSAETSDPG